MHHRLVPLAFLCTFGCAVGLDGFKDPDDTGALDDGFGGFSDAQSGGTGSDGGGASGGSSGGGSTNGGSSSGGSTGGDPNTDADNDGYTADVDCDDNDRTTHPGAASADSTSACMTDADGDRYGDQYVSSGITPGTDCDDNNPNRNPGTPEVAFDGIDQDCSGADTGNIVTATGSGVGIYDYEQSWGYANVAGCGTVQDVEVTVNITHSFVPDLTVTLYDPPMRNAVVLQYNSYTNDNGYGISGTWSSFGTGTLTAYGSMSSVLGIAGSGQWGLEIADDAFLDEGTLNSWSLTLYCI